MKGTLTPKVKICCISSIQEARIAIKYGATSIGLVAEMPSGPGVINDTLIADISASIPSKISTYLLTSKSTSLEIIEHHKKVNTSTIQIVDYLKQGNYDDIRLGLPGVDIVQVIHVLNKASIEKAIELAPLVDYLLLDSGNPNLRVKELGGTGKTHNWEISKIIREEVGIPIYLAGGLNSSNINRAIQTVQPYGIDLCSGVRTNDQLDENKLKEFFEAIKNNN